MSSLREAPDTVRRAAASEHEQMVEVKGLLGNGLEEVNGRKREESPVPAVYLEPALVALQPRWSTGGTIST